MFSLFIGIICIIGLVIGTILSVSDFGIFFDAPAFGIVIVGAFLYCIAAGGDAAAVASAAASAAAPVLLLPLLW